MTSRSPSRISCEDRLAVLGRWRRRLLAPDGTEQHRRNEEAERIEQDRDRCGQELDEEAADPERHELGRRPARGQRGIGVDQAIALDDRRQVGVVGRVEEGRQDRRQAGHDQELPVGQDAEREGDGGRAKQRGSPEVRPDEDRPPAKPVDPRAGDEPEEEGRHEVQAAQDGDLDGAGAEHQDGRERQRDPGDERAEDRDGRRGPDAHERRVPPERGVERVAHEGGAYTRPVSGCTRRDHRPSGGPKGPAVHSHFLGTPESGATRTTRPWETTLPESARPPHGVLPGPCSTP